MALDCLGIWLCGQQEESRKDEVSEGRGAACSEPYGLVSGPLYRRSTAHSR